MGDIMRMSLSTEDIFYESKISQLQLEDHGHGLILINTLSIYFLQCTTCSWALAEKKES